METPEQQEGQAPSELDLLKKRADTLGVPYSNNIGLQTLKDRINAKLGEDAGSEGEGESQEQEGGDEQEEATPPAAPAAPAPVQQPDPAAEVNGFEAAAAVAAAKDTRPPVAPTPAPAPEPVAAAAPVSADAIAAALAALGLTPELIAQAAALRDAGEAVAIPQIKARPGKKLSLRQHLHNEQMKLVRVRITCMDPKKKDLEGEIITVANKHLGTVKHFVPFGAKTEEGWHIPHIIYKALQRRQFVNIRVVKDKRTGFERVERNMAKEFAIEVLPPLTEGELQSLAVAQLAAGSLED